MAGPVGSLLLPQKLTLFQHGQMESTLREISLEVERDANESFNFQVGNMRTIGGSYFDRFGGRPFGVAIYSADRERDADDLLILAKEFGFLAHQEAGFYAMSKSPDDHRILGELLLHFARLWGGIVNFSGALLPPLPATFEKSWLWREANWSAVEPFFSQMIQGMRGKVVSIEYQTSQTRSWAYHVADAEFMESWLRHPNFHMIK